MRARMTHARPNRRVLKPTRRTHPAERDRILGEVPEAGNDGRSAGRTETPSRDGGMMRANPAAIGYLRHDICGPRRQWDDAQIRSVASRLGYELLTIVTVTDITDTSMYRLIDLVRNLAVDAVVSPGLDHFDGEIPVELVRVADVITVNPENTYARWFGGHVDMNVSTHPGEDRRNTLSPWYFETDQAASENQSFDNKPAWRSGSIGA